MNLQIFDVEHGACSLLTADNGTRKMFDCGHNGSTGWRPGAYLKASGIASLEMLVITNYDEDHVSGANDLFDRIEVNWLMRNKSVDSRTIYELKSETGMGLGIERLFDEIEGRFTGDPNAPQPEFEGLREHKTYWHSYPTFDDENNLSLLSLIDCHGVGVLFTGDLERAGWIKMLERDDFRKMLPRVRVLMAPHHGRESGCCEEAMELMTNLNYVVVSDKGYQYDTQITLPFYRRFTKGGPFRGADRQVLTTRKDGSINFTFNPDGWCPS